MNPGPNPGDLTLITSLCRWQQADRLAAAEFSEKKLQQLTGN
jgi:hypothetical protein